MKKRFRFRLETVENLRKRETELALKKLAVAQNAFTALVDKKAFLFRDLERSLLSREGLSGASQLIAAFQLQNEFILGCKVRIFQTDQAIFRSKKNVEKALREYIVAKRRSRALELLRERAYAEYRREVQKADAKATEEIYASRAYIAAMNEADERADAASDYGDAYAVNDADELNLGATG